MIILLISHIIIALSSIAWASIVAIRPSYQKIYVSYAFIGTTLVSGTALVLLSSRPLLASCLTGLVYVTGMTIATIIAHVRIKQLADARETQE